MYTYSEYMSEEFIKGVLEPFLMKCKASRTAREYVGYVRILCDTCKKDFWDIDDNDIQSAVQKWQSKGLARRTIRTRLSCYSSVAKFILEELDINADYLNPFDSVIRPDVCDNIKPQRIPSLAEMDQILTQAKKEGAMWYLILALVSRACLSPTKITKIVRDNVIADEGVISLYFDNKSIVPLPDDVSSLLMTYLDTLTLSDEVGHVFYNKHGRALTLKNLDTGIAQIIKKAGLEEHYTLINIRSRAILELAKAGASETAIAHYADLGAMRTRQFMEARSILDGCPANLVNYRLLDVANA